MNTSANKTESGFEDFKNDFLVISCIVLAVLGVCSAIVNVVLLLVIRADPYRLFNKPVVGLNVCFLWNSLFGSLVMVPGYIAYEIYRRSLRHQDENIFKFILMFLTRIFICSGNLTFTLKGIDGQLGLVKPHLVRRLATRKNIKIVLVSFSCVSVIYCLLPLSGAGSYKMYSLIYIQVFVLSPVVVITSVSGYVYYRLRKPVRVGSHEK